MEDRFESGELSLSSAQLGVWLSLLKFPETSAAYHLGSYLEIMNGVDTEILAQAGQIVFDSTPCLRLQFFQPQDKALPYQRVRRAGYMRGELLDFRDRPNPLRAAQEWIESDMARPFDLGGYPLFRWALLQVADRHFWSYGNYHHLIIDGMGMHIVAHRIGATYSALTAGDAIPKFPVSDHVEYLDDLHRYRSSQKYFADKKFWSAHHRSSDSRVSLSVKSERRATGSYQLTSEEVIGRGDAKNLKALGDHTGMSLAKLMIGLAALFLHRATGSCDVPIGLPIHGRSAKTRDLIWMCASILPIRLSIPSNMMFYEFISAINLQLNELLMHRRYPSDEIGREKTSHNTAPLYSVVVNVLDSGFGVKYGAEELSGKGLGIGPIDDLCVMVTDQMADGQIRIQFRGNPELYEQWEIDSYVEAFATLLRDVAAQPDRRLSEFNLVPDAQRDEFSSLNNTSRAYAFDPLHKLVERSVASQPNTCAISTAKCSLTYQELNKRANKLAHFLAAKGVERGQIVGVLLERTPELIVALLALSKLGATYLPLDPLYPSDRIKFMISDAGAIFLLVDLSHLGFSIDVGAEVIGCGVSAYDEHSDAHIDCGTIRPSDIAYIIYTSGSTGRPKGVLIEQRSVCNLLSHFGDLLGLRTRAWKVAAISPLIFDIAVLEIFLPLAFCQTVVLVDRSTSRDGLRLLATIVENGVDLLQATPTTWRMLLAAGSLPSDLTALCGGEALSSELADRLESQVKEAWNVYGPTETTVWSLSYRLGDARRIAIGKPIDNTTVHVVDKYGCLVPLGCPGELLIGGEGLAKSYLNRSDLTAEKFVFVEYLGRRERVYRTGDIVRHRKDHEVEFIGRVDNQIKIRGYRIEIGEIVSVIREQPEVSDAVVVVASDARGDSQLIAFLVPVGPNALNLESIRSSLRAQLPEYMIPLAFHTLDKLPLTVSGKVDRSALPSIPLETIDRPFIAPRCDVELRIVKLIEDVLGVHSIGITDSFFEIGGTSLSAMDLSLSIESDFGIHLGIDELFELESTENIAAKIKSELTQGH